MKPRDLNSHYPKINICLEYNKMRYNILLKIP